MNKLPAILLLLIALLAGSCQINDPEYTADYLLPLVKTRLKVEHLSELGRVRFRKVISLPDVSHIFSPVAVVPPFSGQVVGPLSLEDNNDSFIRARLDTASFELGFVNNFPINIKSGTRVVITNSSNPDVVFDHTLTEDVAAMGGQVTFRLMLSSTSPWIDNDLLLYLYDFASDGSSGQLADFGTYNNIVLTFNIYVLKINEVEVLQGKLYNASDTSSFRMSSEGSSHDITEGTFTLFLSNGFPANYSIQSYFMNDSYVIIDSLLLASHVASPEVNSQGYVVPASIQEQHLSATWSKARVENLRANARYLYTRARLRITTPAALPPADPVRLRHENQVHMQLVGDLKVQITPLN